MQSDKVKVMAGSHDGDAVEQHVGKFLQHAYVMKTHPCMSLIPA